MRMLLIGQAAFGARTLEALLANGENVVAVHTPPDRPGAKADPLKELALGRGIPVFQPSTYRDDRVFAQYRELRPDLTILAFVTAIIPAKYFEAASRGAICYHPSLLPRHRGGSAINWAIIMGETRTGLTIFRPDGGIDTGPILLQKEVAISPEETTGSLYFNHLFPMGIEAIVEAVQLIREDRAPSIPQDEALATYEPLCDDRVAAIEWTKPAEEVYNLVRGCDPQPGAYTYWRGEKVRLFGVALRKGAIDGPPGAVVGIKQEGLHVALAGGVLVVAGLRGPGRGKLSAPAWSDENGVREGDRFGNPE